MLKNLFCTICAGISSVILLLFGDLSMPFYILLIFMIIDFVSGLILSGIFKKSTKTENGGLSSSVGWKGLIKKCLILVMVIIANQLDILLQVNYIRNVVIIGFATNELISIVENMGLMGIYIPKPIEKAIEILKDKAESEE